MKLEREVADEFPLHYYVWKNNTSALNSSIPDLKSQLERLDARGRTPLMLAVTLDFVECARILIDHGANVNVENAEGWTVVQEASSTGNAALLHMILEKRDHQRHNSRMLGVPQLLQKLKDAPDFYMEMKWEFTSWLPLVSRLCPSDTYKVYKQGSKVRIDTTLLGFDQNSWQRGNKSYLFKGDSDDKALLMEMDHEAKEVYIEELHTVSDTDVRSRQFMAPSDHAVTVRLTTPIVHTYVDTDKISFERNKCGIWGWRSDKTEVINGRESKVFSATNVELVTKTRTEHLSLEDKAANRSRNQRFPLQSLLGVAQMNDETGSASDLTAMQDIPSINTSKQVTLEEYFDPSVDLGDRDIGRSKEMTTKIQKFKATLWLCDDFPLSLPEQIMPIVDLMAISSSHFAKLKDFIQMQLPSGFPIKIEIPLFHVMNACVTFGNVFGCDEPVVGVSTLQETDRLSCIVDDSCFEPPSEYVVYGMAGAENIRRQFSMDEDDELLQYAIQQSLVDAGTENDQVDIWEALKAPKPSRPNTPQPLGASRSPLPQRPSSAMGLRMSAEEEQLQRAIAASLEVHGMSAESVADAESSRRVDDSLSSPGTAEEQALAEALALSARESELEERRRKEEDEILQRILQLSMVEK